MKCTVCKMEKPIIYKSVLDGNVCTECLHEHFKVVDNEVKSKHYDKGLTMSLVTDLDPNTHRLMCKAFADVQSRYKYYIESVALTNKSLVFKLKSTYRGCVSLIKITVNRDKSSYYVMTGWKTVRQVEFK